VDSTEFFGTEDDHSIYFALAVACAISATLLLNAGRSLPTLIPLSVAMLYFWYALLRPISADGDSHIYFTPSPILFLKRLPKGVVYADQWKSALDDVSSASQHSKSEYQCLVAGTILALFGTGTGVVIEVLFPKEKRFAANTCFIGMGEFSPSIGQFHGELKVYLVMMFPSFAKKINQ
jgi:hypothetical protein